jgi:hypothetical protein
MRQTHIVGKHSKVNWTIIIIIIIIIIINLSLLSDNIIGFVITLSVCLFWRHVCVCYRCFVFVLTLLTGPWILSSTRNQ